MNNGILLIDKPYGWSSNFTLQQIKKILNVNKIGYSGTLDKLATGILPILINNCTKYSKYISNYNKSYKVLLYLGISTNTYDASGSIIKYGKINFNFKKIKEVIKKFIGNIIQITPIYSSMKYFGKRMRDYSYLNKKIIIPRHVTVYYINIVYWNYNFLELDILCSKGTYIRSIVDDIGKKLKCGAYVFSLRRIKINNYKINNTLKINDMYKIYNSLNYNITNLINFYGIKFNNF